MKKGWMTALLVLVFIASSPVSYAVPDYAKWGVIAVKAAQQKYNADIIDYEHIGRTQIQPELAEEKFKLWVRSKPGTEFGVFVTIRFDPVTDQIKAIQFQETDR